MRCLLLLLSLLTTATAFGAQPLHLLIPAGPGGGLDSTARAIGSALQAGSIREPVSYENMTGGGGGRALGYFVETAERQSNTLLINSTPLIVRSLQGLFPHSYQDLVPVAALVAEYNVLAVRADSPLTSWDTLLEKFKEQPQAITVGGGSVRGSLDHVVIVQVMDAAGINPRAVRYLPYDGGGKAMLALLGEEIDVLSTGLGETLAYVASGDLRVLAIAAPERAPQLPEVPTLKELGTPVVFANWRGLFAAPGTSAAQAQILIEQIEAARAQPQWQQSLQRYGWTSLGLNGDAFGEYLQQQEAQLRQTMTQLGFIR